jgi:2-C-methyl-D-erythritol 4-phosphate cytidylyltransferase
MKRPDYWAVLPAAGVGRRMGAQVPKQYLTLRDRPVIEHTLFRLCAHPLVAGVVVVLAADDSWWQGVNIDAPKPVVRTLGGKERCHSVLNGIEALSDLADAADWVLVHDAVRPCVRLADIDRLITTLSDHPVGGLLGLPVEDTIKRADSRGTIAETVSRQGLWRALTPQMFRFAALRQALLTCIEQGMLMTDEAQAMELTGNAPQLVEGSPDNIKITRPTDLALAELFLTRDRVQS